MPHEMSTIAGNYCFQSPFFSVKVQMRLQNAFNSGAQAPNGLFHGNARSVAEAVVAQRSVIAKNEAVALQHLPLPLDAKVGFDQALHSASQPAATHGEVLLLRATRNANLEASNSLQLRDKSFL